METYNFKKNTLNVDDSIMTGFMDGTGIAIEKNEDDGAIHVGADGVATWSESNDNTATLTITLKQVSPSLRVLRNLAKEKREFSFSLIDNNTGGLKVTSTQARILRTPGLEAGDEVGGVEIQIVFPDYNPQ